METLLVVENPKAWRLPIDGGTIVSARDYLSNPKFADAKRVRAFNLCRNYAYQSIGYYVSLLAAARGHKPLPSVKTLQDLRSAQILRIVSEDLQRLIDKSLASLRSERFQLSIYWGRNLAARYDRLCQALFNHFPAPLLRADFERMTSEKTGEGRWRLRRLRAIAWQDIPHNHEEFVVQQAQRFFRRPRTSPLSSPRYDIAILVNPDEKDAPSDEKALQRFERAARSLGARCTFLTPADYGRVGEFDALFIRETTRVNHHTFRFSSRAAAEGLVVIDDPESIVRCTNKVYCAEVFRKHGVPTPKTRIVTKEKDTARLLEQELGFPIVLKQPDSSFSQGVKKARDATELKAALTEWFATSELLVAQEYLPSDYDWRIGVLDGKPLYACKYFMARGHWQIQVSEGEKRRYGKHETLPLAAVPEQVLSLAVAATRPIGNGLYGVDIKATEKRLVVIEVNDNPSIEAGCEDAVLKDDLYLAIARMFVDRIEARGVHSVPFAGK